MGHWGPAVLTLEHQVPIDENEKDPHPAPLLGQPGISV